VLPPVFAATVNATFVLASAQCMDVHLGLGGARATGSNSNSMPQKVTWNSSKSAWVGNFAGGSEGRGVTWSRPYGRTVGVLAFLIRRTRRGRQMGLSSGEMIADPLVLGRGVS
jgi:hypothetical protein